MTELEVAGTFIFTTLRDDPSIANLVEDRIYEDVAPQPAMFPLIVFSCSSSRDIVGASATRLATAPNYLVRAIGRSSGGSDYAAIDPIAERIDELLHGARAKMDGGTILSAIRDEPFSMVESDGATIYCHRGGIYRLMIH